MRVVRVQLFSLIIRGSEVESAHLCGGKKSLALFTPHSISRGCFPGWLGPRESRLIHSSSVRAIKILPPRNSGFLCYGRCCRKGADTRTRPRGCQRNLKEKPQRNLGILLLSMWELEKEVGLCCRLDFRPSQKGELRNAVPLSLSRAVPQCNKLLTIFSVQ